MPSPSASIPETATPTAQPATAATAMTPAGLKFTPAPADDLPTVMSVMCPAGFTAHSTVGLSLNQPLFARVTFRTR